MQRIKWLLLALAATAVMALSLGSVATAAPITCPGGQTPTHEGGTWFCENDGGNPTGAGRHKGTGDRL